MTPTVETDLYSLYLADCLDVLPTLAVGSVDIVVTSPPYNTIQHDAKPSGIHAASTFVRKMHSAYRDDKPEKEYQEWLVGIIGQCMRVAQGIVWVNHKVRFRNKVGIHPLRFLPFPLYQEIVWNRNGAIALNCRRFAPSHEAVYGFGEPHYWNDDYNTRLAVWKIPIMQGQVHPCPYPIRLNEPLVSASCPPRGAVLDPFMGSGTTGVACLQTGRRFIGIEMDPRYFDFAEKRIREAATGGPLFEGLRQQEMAWAGADL